jgi:hypothetical protein
MRAMRDHLIVCERCARTDVQVRRSLMVVRSLPQIEPSADFMARLNVRLREVERRVELVVDLPTPGSPRNPWWMRAAPSARSMAAVAAGLVALVAITVSVTWRGRVPESAAPSPTTRITVSLKPPPAPIADATIMAAVPTGIPVWSAMFAAGQLPSRFASADLLDQVGDQR